MDLPLISDREVYGVGYAVNRLDEYGNIFITASSIDQDQEFLQDQEINIPESGKMVRVDLNYFSMQITPLSLTDFKVTLISNMNPKLKIIPYSIINFFARKVILVIFYYLFQILVWNQNF